MVDGSLARFLVFQTDDDVPDRNRRPKPVGDVPARPDRGAAGDRRRRAGARPGATSPRWSRAR